MRILIRHMPFALRAALGILVISTLMAFWAPYGTGFYGWPGVWFYWAGLMVPGWTIGLLFETWLRRRFPAWPFAATYLTVAVVASLTVITANYVAHAINGVDLATISHARLVLQVSVLTTAITLVYGLARRGIPSSQDRPAESTDRSAASPLADKLEPMHRRADLLALMSEDHYVRVYTRAGESLVRMRLSDAMAAVSRIDGARTHRSWWVARDAVDRIERRDGKTWLILGNGLRVPVSRTQIAHLREAGWI